ncbi:MAG: redox-sensing transcriptional repressor Rex [Armatimonas sp.]
MPRFFRYISSSLFCWWGAGNLGTALIAYPGLEEHKFRIVAAFDNDPAKLGRRLEGMDILPTERLGEVNEAVGARLAILAVPANAAQPVTEVLVANGIRGILNFAPTLLRVPPSVVVRNVSFLQELAVLSYQLTERDKRDGA